MEKLRQDNIIKKLTKELHQSGATNGQLADLMGIHPNYLTWARSDKHRHRVTDKVWLLLDEWEKSGMAPVAYFTDTRKDVKPAKPQKQKKKTLAREMDEAMMEAEKLVREMDGDHKAATETPERPVDDTEHQVRVEDLLAQIELNTEALVNCFKERKGQPAKTKQDPEGGIMAWLATGNNLLYLLDLVYRIKPLAPGSVVGFIQIPLALGITLEYDAGAEMITAIHINGKQIHKRM